MYFYPLFYLEFGLNPNTEQAPNSDQVTKSAQGKSPKSIGCQ